MSTLDKFLATSKAAMFMAIASFFVAMPVLVDRQLTATREDAKIVIADTRKEVVTLVNTRFDSLQGSVTDWLGTADKRLGSIEYRVGAIQKDSFGLLNQTRTDLFQRVDVLTANVDKQLSVTNASVANLTGAYAGLPKTFEAKFGEQTDCTTNGLCWQNLTTDLLTSSRFAMRDVSVASDTFNKQFPKMIDNTTLVSTSLSVNIPRITTSFANTAENIDRLTKPHWYDRLLGYGLNGALLYRQFNPAQQVVQGVTTYMSAKP